MPANVLFTSLDARLRFAIGHRRLIEVIYKGKRRVVEPHDYGVLQGRERLLAYQRQALPVIGRRVIGWRLLDVNQMTSCEVREDSFTGSRHQLQNHHYRWDVVYARVE